MNSILDSALSSYLATYRDLIETERVGESIIISFPFHLAAGHRIEISVTDLGAARCIISDSARTLGEVQAAGFAVTPQMRERLERVAGISGLRIVDRHLVLESSYSQLGQSIQRFLEVSKTIGDVYLVHKPRERPDNEVMSQVRAILDAEGVLYRLGEKVLGEIEQHPFDLIAPPNGHPGFALSILTGQNTHSVAQIWGFKCEDIKRGPWYQKAKTRIALVYDVRAQPWSDSSRMILESRADIALASDSLQQLRDRVS